MRARWHQFLCWLGIHKWTRSPRAKTSEEIGTMMVEAKDGWQVMGLMLSAERLCNLKVCVRCEQEN